MEEDNLIKEINIKKTRDDITLPLKSIATTANIANNKLLFNINKLINAVDTGAIDYTAGGVVSDSPPVPLNNVFCDNIIIYYIIARETISKKRSSNPEVNNRSITNKAAGDMLKERKPVIKRVMSDLLNTNMETHVKHTSTTTVKDNNGITQTAQMFKIDCSSVNVDNVLNLITSIDNINKLQEEGLFIHDIDFTRDYAGVFNKDKLLQYLTSNKGFYTPINKEEEEDYVEPDVDSCIKEEFVEADLDIDVNDDGTVSVSITPVECYTLIPDTNPTPTEYKRSYLILNNDKDVSRNCLTFTTHDRGNKIRYKYYNKFVQSMESPSVRSSVGAHINNWVNNPELYLKQAIDKAINTGLLRMEVTFYINPNSTLNREQIYKEMEFLNNLIPPEQIYYNSITAQFNLLCEKALYNVAIYDVNMQTAFVARYQNKIIDKVNGFYVKDANSIKFSNALRHYCSNKPIALVLADINKDNGVVTLQVDNYIRVTTNGSELITYINSSSENLQGCRATKDSAQPLEKGLLPNTTFNFVLAKNAISLTKSTKYTTVFKSIDADLITIPDEGVTIRSINKKRKELEEDKDFSIKKQEQLEKCKQLNLEIEDKVTKSRNKEKIRQKLIPALKNTTTYTKKFLDLEDNTTMFVHAFKETNTRYGKTYLLACCDKDISNDDAEVFMYWSTYNVTDYINKTINSYKLLNLDKIKAYGTLTGVPLLTLRKTGTYINSTKNKCAALKIVNSTENAEEDISYGLSRKLEILPPDVKIKNCLKLDDCVKEGDIIVIDAVRLLKKSVIVSAIINKERSTWRTYLVNYWLKEIVNKELSNGVEFSVVVGPKRTTPNNVTALTYIK